MLLVIKWWCISLLVTFIIVTNVHKHELKNNLILPRNSEPSLLVELEMGHIQATPIFCKLLCNFIQSDSFWNTVVLHSSSYSVDYSSVVVKDFGYNTIDWLLQNSTKLRFHRKINFTVVAGTIGSIVLFWKRYSWQ